MESRHDDTLTDRLEHILHAGCVQILWNELYHWYNVKKIAAGTWDDLAKRWQKVSGGKSALKRVESAEGIYLFDESKIQDLNAKSVFVFWSSRARLGTE
jgi:hypothetical protein